MNILIVESKNDQYFIEALVKKMLTEQKTKVLAIDKYVYSSLDEKQITTQLETALTTKEVSKIGIILDMDNENEENRLSLINRCLNKALENTYEENFEISLNAVNQFFTISINEYNSVQIACHFTNVDGRGELETILKKIKTKDSSFVNCLDTWVECIKQKNKTVVNKGETGDITHKEILKLWVDFYKRFDTLTKKQRKQAEKNTNWQGIWTGQFSNRKGEITKLKTTRGTDIFDLNHECLTDLRDFLHLFKEKT